MQQRQLVGRVARDEDMRNAGLHGQRIGNGYAARVFFDIDVFQTDIVNVRTAAYGCQHIFGNKYAFFAVLLPMDFYIAVRIKFDLGFSIQMQFQFFADTAFASSETTGSEIPPMMPPKPKISTFTPKRCNA